MTERLATKVTIIVTNADELSLTRNFFFNQNIDWEEEVRGMVDVVEEVDKIDV